MKQDIRFPAARMIAQRSPAFFGGMDVPEKTHGVSDQYRHSGRWHAFPWSFYLKNGIFTARSRFGHPFSLLQVK
jgi:hypothetical protein